MVLLPQPDGPIRLTKRPCGIDSVTGASAWKAPVGVLNVMLTSATHSFGAENDMRTPLDRVAARIAQSPADYIAKAMPTAIAVCVDTRFDRSSKAASQWPGITPSAQAFGSRVPR